MSKRIVCYVAISDNPAAAKRLLRAVEDGFVDQFILVYSKISQIESFGESPGTGRRTDVESSHHFTWIGDALREVSTVLVDMTQIDDKVLITSSEFAEAEILPVKYLFAAAAGSEITFRNYIYYAFGEVPQKFGLFDECVLSGDVIHDPLFTIFWKNLTTGMTKITDQYYAQSIFAENFGPRFRVHNVFLLDPGQVSVPPPAMSNSVQSIKPTSKDKAPATARAKPSKTAKPVKKPQAKTAATATRPGGRQAKKSK